MATRSAHARALVEALQATAAAAGPPRDDEIEKLTAERWPELDRPVAVRTTHAVVIAKKPADDEGARALAERLTRELAGVREPRTFIERARALAPKPGAGIELKVEQLPPVVPDGRTFDPQGVEREGQLDETYTRAAHALVASGDQSPVIKTRFGYHVILLQERLPEHRPGLEERRRLLEREVMARRGQSELKRLLTTLRSGTALEVQRAADELTAGVGVDQ